MKTGIKGHCEAIVSNNMTAKAVGSGTLDVLSTPSMIALIEKTTLLSVEPYLEKGYSTVGIGLNVTHDAATPVGERIYCDSVLVNILGRKLVFEVKAYDDGGYIGGGIHERFIVESEKFRKKTYDKITKKTSSATSSDGI